MTDKSIELRASSNPRFSFITKSNFSSLKSQKRPTSLLGGELLVDIECQWIFVWSVHEALFLQGREINE